MGCGCDSAKCGLEPGDKRHGTRNGHNRGCRCDAYREVQKAYYKSRRKAGLEPGDRRHGTTNGYINFGCRCDACSKAQREHQKVYYVANPDVQRAKEARRRARKAGAFIGPAFTRQQVWDRDNGICHICNLPADPGDWHLEHIVPLVRGGAHSFEGCAVSHPTCNLRKGARLLDELDAACIMSTFSH